MEMTVPFVGATKNGTGNNTHFGYLFGGSSSSSVPKSLKKVTITGGVIGNAAFRACTNLENVVIGDDITALGYQAFEGCSNLTSIVIPVGITKINEFAFKSCDRLTNVYYEGTSEAWAGIHISGSNSNLTSATRYYYSETEPALNAEGTAYNSNYWHYDVNGDIVEWIYKQV